MPDRTSPRLSDNREHKMVLILRGELRLTAGKAAVQAAHAAVMLVRLGRAARPTHAGRVAPRGSEEDRARRADARRARDDRARGSGQ